MSKEPPDLKRAFRDILGFVSSSPFEVIQRSTQNTVQLYREAFTDDFYRAFCLSNSVFGFKIRRNEDKTAFDHMKDVAERSANRVDDNQEKKIIKTIGIVHDLIEDSHYTISDLRHMGFSNRVCEAVDALTKRPGERYMNYIARLSQNADAVLVKPEDIAANTDAHMKAHREFFLYPFTLAYLSAVQAGHGTPDVIQFANDNKAIIAPDMDINDYNDFIRDHSGSYNKPSLPALVAA